MSRNGASSTGRMGGCRRAKEFLRGVISHPLFVQDPLAVRQSFLRNLLRFTEKDFFVCRIIICFNLLPSFRFGGYFYV